MDMSRSPAPSRSSTHAVLGRLLATGGMASLMSMAVLAWHGRWRHGSSTALINSPSHVVHGDRALRANAFSLRFTLLGALIHHLSSMFWAVLYEGLLGAWRKGRSLQRRTVPVPHAQPPSTVEALATASVLSGIAWLVDTRLVPRRLTPGFERRSSSTGMVLIYGAFAVGLAAGAVMARRASVPAEAGAP